MLEKGRTRTYSLDVRDGAGAAATVTSGTYEVFAPSGVLAASGNCGITGGVPSFSLLNTVTADEPFSQEWVLVWTLTVAGRVDEIRQEAHLVVRPLRPVIDGSDLSRRHSDLSVQYTVAQLQVFVDEAFDEMQAKLIAEGKYPQHVFSDWALSVPHRSLALSFAMRDMATYTQGRGKYTEEGDRYFKLSEHQWGQLVFKMDRNQDDLPEPVMEAGDGVVFMYAGGGR